MHLNGFEKMKFFAWLIFNIILISGWKSIMFFPLGQHDKINKGFRIKQHGVFNFGSITLLNLMFESWIGL